ncbi:MAG: ankyrin repeat domain-containing protein [Spirochaetia bacterium]
MEDSRWAGNRRGAIEQFDLVMWTRAQIQTAIEEGADFNVRGSDSMTPLMWASMFNRDPEEIKLLVKAGAEVNARDDYGFTPLMFAAEFNQNPAVILTLLEAGADANARDNAGNTAFENARNRRTLQETQVLSTLEQLTDAEEVFQEDFVIQMTREDL